MRILSLFDGISCGMVALERAGIPVERYVAYEIDDHAKKISAYNYPEIEQRGNVFDAAYNEGEFDLLIGGSPCTYWSIARTGGNRETTSSGVGFELFNQYVRALREVKPKYFLYENNNSISQDIKDEISKALGVQPIMIDSSLLSAQVRKRVYWTNIPDVKQPQDKNIMLQDVVDFSQNKFRPVGKWAYQVWGVQKKIDILESVDSKKSHTLTTAKNHPRNHYLNKDRTQYCNLSVKQWEALQTLPEGYADNVDVAECYKYKAIGNGWTVDVIAHILKYIKEDKNEN